MNGKHIFTSEEKLDWWGYGEWVEEPDEIKFEHLGIECIVLRIAIRELHSQEFHMFGGYFNGYIRIPTDHPYYQKRYEDMDIDCHWGLTFGECSDGHWVGFDCAHSGDYIPSIEKLKKTHPSMMKWRKEEEMLKKEFNLNNSPIFQKNYRNINYCIEQCKSMAEQLKSTAKEVKTPY